MSDPKSAELPQPRPPLISGDLFGNLPQLVYLLYLVGFVLHVTTLAGLVLAYVNRGDASPVERSHYDFQISTFWRGLLMLIAGAILLFVAIGWLVFLFWSVWTIVRCVKGLSKLSRGEPMPRIGWGFG
jgi:uncharacterized membrane protein